MSEELLVMCVVQYACVYTGTDGNYKMFYLELRSSGLEGAQMAFRILWLYLVNGSDAVF